MEAAQALAQYELNERLLVGQPNGFEKSAMLGFTAISMPSTEALFIQDNLRSRRDFEVTEFR
jgi:hypothetical protein